MNSQDPLFGLFALNAGNGSLVWRSTSTGESLTSPSVANGVVYDISELGELVVLDAATGAVLNTLSDQSGRPFAGERGAQPAVVNGVVYAVTGDIGGANALECSRWLRPLTCEGRLTEPRLNAAVFSSRDRSVLVALTTTLVWARWGSIGS